MKIFFDTEFTGLVPGTTLISLGMVSENNDKFYCEFTDYEADLIQGNQWIKENVLDNLYLSELMPPDGDDPDHVKDVDGIRYSIGNTDWNRDSIIDWLEEITDHNEPIQFIADVCHYDMYLLINQVFGGAQYVPDNINPACYDICQLMSDCGADLLDEPLKTRIAKGVMNLRRYSEQCCDEEDMGFAFNASRELVCKALSGGYLPEGKKHNSLYDAEVTKWIYSGLVH